jgi:hypothetical protein
MVNILICMRIHYYVQQGAIILSNNIKRKVFKVLDVKPIEHKGQKRKLVLTEDGNVYEVKLSKLENTVKKRTICLRTICICIKLLYFRNILFKTLICVCPSIDNYKPRFHVLP